MGRRPTPAQQSFPTHRFACIGIRQYANPQPRLKYLLSLEAISIAVAGIAAFLFSPMVIVLGFYFYYQVFEAIIPGVSAGDLDLSGMRISEAAEALDNYFNWDRKVLVTDGLGYWQIPLSELGVRVEGYQTAQNAYNIGRNQGFWENMQQMITSMRSGWQIIPEAIIEPANALDGLKALDLQVGIPPENASISLQGDSLVSLPGKLGSSINIEESLVSLAADPARVAADGFFQLVLKPVPPAVDDASTLLEEAQRLLESKPSIQLYDPIKDEYIPLTLPRELFASWIRVEGGDEPVIGIKENELDAYLSEQSSSLGSDRWLDAAKQSQTVARNLSQGRSAVAILSYKSTRYQVLPGDTLLKISWKLGFPMWKILDANPGLDIDHLPAGMMLKIPSKDVLLPLLVIHNKRIVINITKQRLWAYQDGKEVKKFLISTGIDRSPTQPGVFQVQTHKKNAYASVWDLYMPNFLGIYEAWPGFMNGIHGLPTLSSGRQLWASILGRPASYGCIILDLEASKWLYDWAEDGVVVEIMP